MNDNILMDYQEILKKMADPSYLHTMSMDELYETIYPSRQSIISGLLYPCTYLFAGAPKLGKSFMMLQLAYHVSTGIPLWNYPVEQGDVLYLALEDDYSRLQKRLYRMFGAESTEKLHFAIKSYQLDNGLEKQLEQFLLDYPKTKLIIIDTLQKVRDIGGADYSYSNDYQVIEKLKHFSDNHATCILVVHHTRKQKSDDSFDMISGTNGLLGAADGAFILHKDKRTSNAAVLEISGRDQQDQRLFLIRNPDTLLWELEHSETELWKEPPEPILQEIAEMLTAENPDWEGTATQLSNRLSLNIPPNLITKKLNINSGRLLNEYKIVYTYRRTHENKLILFHLNS